MAVHPVLDRGSDLDVVVADAHLRPAGRHAHARHRELGAVHRACANEPPVPDFAQFTNGPIQAYVLAVPKASSQIAITFEEAYFVFGFGPTILASMAGMVAPWLIENELQVRTDTKSTLLAWAANISVEPSKMHGIANGSPMVVAGLQNSQNPSAAIGILGAEVYDGARATLNALAFRAKGQYAAY